MEKVNTNLKFLETKINTKEKMRKFIENQLLCWWPDCSGFTTSFGLLVIAEKKKCLLLKEKGAPQLEEVKDLEESTRKGMMEILLNDPITRYYLPDNITYNRICKDYLNSVLYHKRNDLWLNLKQKIFQKQKNLVIPFKHQINFDISLNMFELLQKFETNDKVSKSKSYFSIKKQKDLLMNNGISLNQNISRNDNNVMLPNENIISNSNNRNLNVEIDSSSLYDRRSDMAELIMLEEEKFKQLGKDVFQYLWTNNYNLIAEMIPQENDQTDFFNNCFNNFLNHTDRIRFMNLTYEERIQYCNPFLFNN